MKFFLVTYFILNGLLGAESHTEIKSNDKSDVSSLTSSGKVSNVLRDILNQESLVRFSMTQRIQGLVLDALDNKNNSRILKQKLNDINTELQSIESEDQKTREENAQLKQELNTVKETIKFDKNLMMIQNESLQRYQSNFTSELQSIAINDQVMKEENARLKQELNTVKSAIKNDKTFIMQQIQNFKRTEITVLKNENSKFKQELSNLNMTLSRNIQNLNNMNETIRKHNDDLRLQFQMINGSLQKLDSQLFNISTQLSPVSLGFPYKSCMDILKTSPYVEKSGVYFINVNDQKKKVYCDMTTDGGGWTVIQKREDGSTDFFRNWNDYKKGFGDPSKNYWIGNDAIHTLTIRDQELRVDLQSFDTQTAYALYSEFKVGNESTKYRLTVGGYCGTAGDSFAYHNGHKFTTRDQDNDGKSNHDCAVHRQGAWWYGNCAQSNLNGLYAGSALSSQQYMYWLHWKSTEALKKTLLMIRPKS